MAAGEVHQDTPFRTGGGPATPTAGVAASCAPPPDGSRSPEAPAKALPLRVDSLVIPIDHVGPYEVVLGEAELPNGILSDVTAPLADTAPMDLVVSEDGMRLEITSLDGGPPFVSADEHGWHPGGEHVEARLVFAVESVEPGAVVEVTDVVVRSGVDLRCQHEQAEARARRDAGPARRPSPALRPPEADEHGRPVADDRAENEGRSGRTSRVTTDDPAHETPCGSERHRSAAGTREPMSRGEPVGRDVGGENAFAPKPGDGATTGGPRVAPTDGAGPQPVRPSSPLHRARRSAPGPPRRARRSCWRARAVPSHPPALP